MGVTQSAQNQPAGNQFNSLTMGTAAREIATSGSNTNSGNSTSEQTTVTVRDHINKEYRSKDHTQHALYSLLNTGIGSKISINEMSNSNTAKVSNTHESPDQSHETPKMDTSKSNQSGNSQSGVNHRSEANMDMHHSNMETLDENVTKIITRAINETHHTDEVQTTNPGNTKHPTVTSQEVGNVRNTNTPGKKEPEKPAEPASTFIHPKKKFLLRQNEWNSPSASHSPPTVTSPSHSQSQAAVTNSKNQSETTALDSKSRSTSEALTVNTTEPRPTLTDVPPRFRVTPMLSPPKSSETVKQCMEKIMEQMLQISDEQDQKEVKPKHKTQCNLIQESIKKFLQDDHSEEMKYKPTYHRSAFPVNKALPHSTAIPRPNPAAFEDRGSSLSKSGKDLTIAQQISNDIRQVLTQPTDRMSVTSHNSPSSRPGNVIVVGHSKGDHMTSSSSQGHHDSHFQGHRDRAVTMDSAIQAERERRELAQRGPYFRPPSDGRSSVDSQSSQPDMRRGSFGKSSVHYDRLRESVTHERNCSSTDTARLHDTRDMDPYRNRSQSLSFPTKHPSRAPHPHPYSHPASLGSSQLSALMAPQNAALRANYGYPHTMTLPPRSHHGEGHDSRHGRDSSRDAVTSHHGVSTDSKSGASRAEGFSHPLAGREGLSGMFYPPQKPPNIHSGSISAGLPRTSFTDQREHVLREAYSMKSSMTSQRDHDVNRDGSKRKYDDRSRAERAPPPLLHISGRHQVPQQEIRDNRNGPMGAPRSRSRSPIHMATPPSQHHEQWNRHDESHADAPLDLSAPSRSSVSPVPKPPVHPVPRVAESRDLASREAKVTSSSAAAAAAATALPGMYPYAAAGALKSAPMTPAQLALYQQDWLKHYRWPGYPMIPSESLAAAQMAQLTAAATAGLLPLDPRVMAQPEIRTSPRPPAESEERERDYQMRQQSRHYSRENSPPHSRGNAASPRESTRIHSPPSLQVPAPTRNMATSPSNMQAINPLQVPNPMMLSPHNRQSPPGARDSKERLGNRSIGPNLLGDFPPEDVLFLRCNLCRDTYGNVHSFIKHFSRDHASEGDPRPHHVMIESISRAKHAIESNHLMRPHTTPSDTAAPSAVRVNRPQYGPGLASSGSTMSATDVSMLHVPIESGPSKGRVNLSPSMMRCPKCPMEFSTRDWGVFKRHMKSHEISSSTARSHSQPEGESHGHPETGTRPLPGAAAGATAKYPDMATPSSLRQPMVCEECHVSFHDNLEWQMHMSISHNNRSCVCRICNVVFSHIDAMYKHVYTAHNGFNAVEVEFNCLSCNKAFTNERSLIEHMKSKECGIDRDSIGSMISFSVKSRVRDQGVSMSPPLKGNRMTPDTTCTENPPNSCESVPLTTMANTMPATESLGSNLKNMIENYMQSQSKAKTYNDSITVIDLIQQKVEQEHRRQSQSSDVTPVTRDRTTTPDVDQKQTKSSVVDARQSPTLPNKSEHPHRMEDRIMSPLKRRLLGYDRPDSEIPPPKQTKMEFGSKDMKVDPSQHTTHKFNAQSIISNIVESAVLGGQMDFESIYKRSIEKMILDEEQKDKRESERNKYEEEMKERKAMFESSSKQAGTVAFDSIYKNSIEKMVMDDDKKCSKSTLSNSAIVKQDADSSLGKEEDETRIKKEDKKYQQNLQGVLHTLVENEAKKMFSSDNIPTKSEPKDTYSDAVHKPSTAPSPKVPVKTETETQSVHSMERNTSPLAHNAPKNDNEQVPDSIKSNMNSYSNENNDKIVPNANSPKAEHKLPETHNTSGFKPVTEYKFPDTKTANQSVPNEVTGNRRPSILERVDSFEEGNLVICLEEEEKQKDSD